MHVIQLAAGILFSILTVFGVFFYYKNGNNVFLAASALFLLIALSCLILAAVRIRKKRRKSRKNATALRDEQEKSENTDVITEEPVEDQIDEDDSEEIDHEEESDREEPEEFSFYREYEAELSSMDDELYLTDNQANLTGRDIDLMTRDELEIAMQRTQIAINSFTRLKMFCEAKGADGKEYYQEKLQQYEEKEELLTYDELTAQMGTLRIALENRTENENDPVSPVIDEPDLDARILQIVSENDGIRPNVLLGYFDPSIRTSVKKQVRKLISEGKLIRERKGTHNLLHAARNDSDESDYSPVPDENNPVSDSLSADDSESQASADPESEAAEAVDDPESPASAGPESESSDDAADGSGSPASAGSESESV